MEDRIEWAKQLVFLRTSKVRAMTRDVGYVPNFEYASAVTVKVWIENQSKEWHSEITSVLEHGDDSRALRTAFAVLMWQDLTRAF